MNYDQIVGQAPATSPELFKAAILAALSDIQKRLSLLEVKQLNTEETHDP